MRGVIALADEFFCLRGLGSERLGQLGMSLGEGFVLRFRLLTALQPMILGCLCFVRPPQCVIFGSGLSETGGVLGVALLFGFG